VQRPVTNTIETKPLVVVSVLTPTWNRSPYLPRVCEGLRAQTFKHFEWIVANDGSTDDTIDVVTQLSCNCDFPVTLMSASVRVGKTRMDNLAVQNASGQFIVWCDSDDWLFPESLNILMQTWNSIPSSDREQFAGVTALCESNTGVLDNVFPDDPYTDVKWNTVFLKMKYDLVLFCRAELLKKTPFLEVDYLVPETSVWNSIGILKTRFIPVALKYINYGSDNCLSWSGLMEYNRGRAYAFARSKTYLSESLRTTDLAWRFITYLRYCIHGEVRFDKAVSMWGGGLATVLGALLAAPIAVMLAIKDRAQGKVRKTHREFNAAANTATIQIQTLNKTDLAS